MTTTPVERLEGAKYSGVPGIGSLQQFLAVPDKYNLKFVFSNDQFYDPLLFFSGWHRLQRLENGIMVWEREDIPPLPAVLPRKEIPLYQRVMWGVVPLLAIVAAFTAFSSPIWLPYLRWLLNLDEGGFHTPLRLRGRFWGALTRPFRGLSRLGVALWAWLIGRMWRLWAWIDGRLRAWSELPAGDESRVVPWQVWLEWGRRLPTLRPATPTAHHVRLALLALIVVAGVATTVIGALRQARTPVAVVQSYYDDLDFRRFTLAYARLDPLTRPSYDQYLLDLSVTGGMVASYGKLNSVRVRVVAAEPERVTVIATTDWVTSLSTYPTEQRLDLVVREGGWSIVLDPVDLTVPPEPFFRRGEVGWVVASRRREVDKPTAFADIPDRPEIQILAARLVRHAGRYQVVGELINSDSDPADVTVTAALRDAEGVELTRYNAQQGIDRDLTRVKGLGLNTIRVFVPYAQFGGPRLEPAMVERLADLLDRAQAQELKVIVTLFDFRVDYSLLRWPEGDRHLEALLTRFRDHPAILAWDLKNEPDLDDRRSGARAIDAWLTHVVGMARRYDPNHLLTIGWSSPGAAERLADLVDIVQFHYYAPASEFAPAYAALREHAPARPLLLGEFGLPTWNSVFPNGHTEAEQAAYYGQLLAALRGVDAAGSLAWTLYDFARVPASVAGRWPWQTGPQAHLGLLRADGSEKPAAVLLASEANLAVPPLPAWARWLKPFWLVVLGVGLGGASVVTLWVRRR